MTDPADQYQRATNTKLKLDFACMEPAAVEARHLWWHNGGQGHWPDCTCPSCANRTKADT
jgi:hypothetical protein